VKINPDSLRALRERSGWSVSKFAAACEISTGYLSNIEAGRKPGSPEVITRMADVLDVPLQALISAWDPEQVA
jgi:transcriptional regulator with XRE-family HTH domain